MRELVGLGNFGLYVWTPKPGNRGATGHGVCGYTWRGVLLELERERAAGEKLIQLKGRRVDGSEVVLLDTREDVDILCLLGAPPCAPLCAPPGRRLRPSGLSARLATA
jgi:hypothetical protein